MSFFTKLDNIEKGYIICMISIVIACIFIFIYTDAKFESGFMIILSIPLFLSAIGVYRETKEEERQKNLKNQNINTSPL
jgi:1,4-dihydroxy-2-naphthoate octaprenyltransferase